MPFPKNLSLHGPVVHKISPDICSSVISWRCPTHHHVVLDSFQQGYIDGLPRYSCGEGTQTTALIVGEKCLKKITLSNNKVIILHNVKQKVWL